MKDIPNLPFSHALVTGSSGSIGRAVARELLDRGCAVTLLARDAQRVPESLRSAEGGRVRIVCGDLADSSALREAVKDVEAVFHAAARVHAVPKTPEEEAAFFEVNVEGTSNLLAAIEEQAIRSFVFFSTIAVFGDACMPIRESLPVDPQTPYAISKYQAEQKILSAGRDQGFSASVLRLSMVYGEGDRGNFQRMLRAIDRGRFVFIGRGDTLKSMTYVENVVEAALLAASSPSAAGRVFVISDPHPYSVREVAGAIAEALGRPTPRLSVPKFAAMAAAGACEVVAKLCGARLPITPRDVRVLLSDVVCDTNLARSELGFRGEVGLREGIARTVQHYRARNGRT